jgi:hypothetical protein
MAYGIIRIQKHSSLAAIKRSGKHKNREQDTPNADSAKTPLNVTEGAKTADELVRAVQNRVNLATVKSGGENQPVLAVEYLITASPEFFENSSEKMVDDYFEKAKNWLKAKHGAANVVSITRHNDEKSPHLSAFIVPLVERQEKKRKRSVIVGRDADGKQIRETREYVQSASINLSAQHYFGGSKQVLSEFQTEFHEKVAKDFNLDRGIKGSKAKHMDVKTWYAGIEKPIQGVTITPEFLQPRVLKKGIFTSEVESPEAVAHRVTQAVNKTYQPMIQNAENSAIERRKATEMKKTTETMDLQLKRANEQIKRLNDAFKPLNELAVLDKNKFVAVVSQVADEVERIRKTQKIEKKLDRGWSR